MGGMKGVCWYVFWALEVDGDCGGLWAIEIWWVVDYRSILSPSDSGGLFGMGTEGSQGTPASPGHRAAPGSVLSCFSLVSA